MIFVFVVVFCFFFVGHYVNYRATGDNVFPPR